MSPPRELASRFRRHLAHLDALGPGDRVVVAVSGGLDSVALLHLLRFAVGEHDLVVAHLDHATRLGSADDASWVRGLARAWRVAHRERRLPDRPTGEAEARRARYAFLEEVRSETDARWIVTAHHADDQAETVLFRVLRGTGISGLRGIRPVEHGTRLLRPLLPFWREELRAWAASMGLRWREDPTNRSPAYARNVLRHRLLPLAEEVHPGARRALVRLADHARRSEAAWGRLVAEASDAVLEEASEARITLARPELLGYDPELRGRVLRSLVRRLGSVLDEAGTRLAVEFTSSGASGGWVELTGGVALARDFDHFVLTPVEEDDGEPEGADSVVRITEPSAGSGRLVLGGRARLVTWGRDVPEASGWSVCLPRSGLSHPLELRAWRPGDRIRLSYGSKKLTKLFAEARVPAGRRRGRPVLVDANGEILWVPGLATSATLPEPPNTDERLTMTITDAED